MNRRKQYIVASLIIGILILAISAYGYIYKEHRNIAAEKAEFKMSAQKLNDALANENEAVKYIDQVIQTHGMITAIEQHSVIIEDKVQVNFVKNASNLPTVGNRITVKGRCVGYDDLLELVKIDQAIVVNNN